MNLIIRHPMDNPHRVTSPFGWREAPVRGGHQGIDIIRLPPVTGTLLIYAVADGVVTEAVGNVPDSHNGNVTTQTAGNHVSYNIGNGIVVRNLHLAAPNPRNNVVGVTHRVGDTLKQGDVVGTMGNTGQSFGRHLHFEMRRNNTPFDPLPFIISAPHENIEPERTERVTFRGVRYDIPLSNVDDRNFALPSDLLRMLTGKEVLFMMIDGVEKYGIRDFAESLGYDVEWTAADGIVIT